MHVGKIKSISITNNFSKNIRHWYEEFRIDVTHFRKTYHSLTTYLGDREFFGKDDINKWIKLANE